MTISNLDPLTMTVASNTAWAAVLALARVDAFVMTSRARRGQITVEFFEVVTRRSGRVISRRIAQKSDLARLVNDAGDLMRVPL